LSEASGGKNVATDAPGNNLDEPDKVLFDRAKRDLDKNKFTVARLTLQTLINTYPDSEFLPQAKYALAESFYRENSSGAMNQAEAEVVAFFALLQEKGRLVDFLMEELTAYDDAQVGAAARVVHQGCRQVLQEHFKIAAVSEAEEGSQVTVPAGYFVDEYRFVGKLSGAPPFAGKLIHKGWKTESVKLPRIVQTDDKRLPVIAPAEVELK